jgi:hypothetical protein
VFWQDGRVVGPCFDLLIPWDPLKNRRADRHFASEAEAAVGVGLGVHLIDHDAILAGDIEAALRALSGTGAELVYRGWMIPPPRYRVLGEALHDRGFELRTSPDDFAGAHHLPNWYHSVADLTAESVWTSGTDLDQLTVIADRLGHGPAVLKDYSKSEKHYWDEAMFIPELSDHGRLQAVARRFLELRADSFDTGFVLRRFESWEPFEWRTWWVDGDCVAATAHPDTPSVLPDHLDVGALRSQIKSLELPFISVDLAMSSSTGGLRVVEIGDGQVSDRPSSYDPVQFVDAITRSRQPPDGNA